MERSSKAVPDDFLRLRGGSAVCLDPEGLENGSMGVGFMRM